MRETKVQKRKKGEQDPFEYYLGTMGSKGTGKEKFAIINGQKEYVNIEEDQSENSSVADDQT